MNVGDLILIGGTGGSAQANEVISGETFTNDAGQGTGTMPNRGAITYTPSTVDQNVAAGYHNGLGKVLGDADLIATNIVSPKNIFGVAGTAIGLSMVTPGSNLLINNAPNSATTASLSYVKVKETKVNVSGTIRVSFTGQQNVIMGGGTLGRVYINGVARGLEQVLNNGSFITPITSTEDFAVNSGDLVQIYIMSKKLPDWTGYVYDFKISIAESLPFCVINL